MASFKERVLRVVGKIKTGETRTYVEVARLAGNPRAARAAGSIMAKNFDPKIPCHRVTRSDGSIGAYNRGGTRAKIKLLRKEGAI
ncbi:MAG: MGMT family protein [Patescibacteria group bacterium]